MTEFRIACSHCAKPVALANSKLNGQCFCGKDCFEAFAVTQRLLADPQPKQPYIVLADYNKQALLARLGGLSAAKKIL